MAWRGRGTLASRRELLWPALILAATTTLLLVMAHIAHFRVLGRHLTPLIVIVLVGIGFGLSRLIFRRGVFPKIIAALFIGLNILSCFSLRFAERHKKDDYRSAARIAKTELAAGKIVWWNADKAGAAFYRVPFSEQPVSRKVWLVRNPEPASVLRESPDVVITSKPDIYDARGVLGDFLERENYRARTNFPAFVIWQKNGN